MSKLTRAQVEKLDSYDEIRRELFTTAEISENDRHVDHELAALKILQDDVSSALARYMKSEKIGFNEITRRLDTTARQTSLIMKGHSNLKLTTITDIALAIGKRARIVFEPMDELKEQPPVRKNKQR